MPDIFSHYEIKNNVQLLLDNELLNDCWNLRRAPELPVKSYRNPISGCGGTIIYDKEEKIFKSWYGYYDNEVYRAEQPGAMKTCYAVSDDGIHWEKPNLGLFEVKGSPDNNVVMNNTGSVYKDNYETDPEKRYKMLYLGDCDGKLYYGLCAAFSMDGIHWNKYGGKDTQLVFGSNDSAAPCFYDPEIKKYVRYGRVNVLAAVEKETALGIPLRTSPDIIRYTDKLIEISPYRTTPPEEDFPGYDDYIQYHEAQDYINRYLHKVPYEYATVIRVGGGSGCNRRIVRAESDDFLHWSTPELVIAPDELDPPKFYGLTACRYEGMYLGLLQVFTMTGHRRNVGDLGYGEGDTIDMQLTFSRDGKHWERLANRPNFIPRGYIGSYDGGMILGTNNVLVEHDDELLFYYTGIVESHMVSDDTKTSQCVARLPKGRLISRCAGDEMGALITKPFVMKYDRIGLNLDSRRGVVRAEITDLNGNPLKGFKATESGEIKTNSLDCDITWNESANLGAIKGQTVRLRMYLWQSKLYSINFKD